MTAPVPALAVECHDLFCLYDAPTGSVAALRGLSLRVPTSERLVVHGPNGSGKSTLLAVLAAEVEPSAGSVRVAGIELARADEQTRSTLRRSTLGLVDQRARRSLRAELDVLDNVALQLRLAGAKRAAAREAAREALSSLGLEALAARRPDTLSGGEAQRVAVAAALAHRPAVVLADEPTGELDAASADAVYDALAHAVEHLGATLVLVTHDPRASRVADRVVRIRDGRLSEQWDPTEPGSEQLVVDDRGWVRLPDALRHGAGAATGAVAVATEDGVLLRGTAAALPAATTTPATARGTSTAAVASGTAAALPAATTTPAATVDEGGPVTAGEGSPATPTDRIVASLRGARVAYAGVPVLDGLDLDVRAGTLTAVSGRSGSGKSTLLRAIAGLAPLDGGDAELLGGPVGRLPRDERAALRRSGVAVVTQGGSLVETLHVHDNLELARTSRGLDRDDDLVARLCALLGLTALAHRPVLSLSGGERQRVAVARALAVTPVLAVLDEPSSQLDESGAEIVARALADAAASGTAVLVATHDPVLLDVAGTVVDLGAARHDPP